MHFWIKVEMDEEEDCAGCERLIKEGEEGYIRAYWAYKDHPTMEGYGVHCESCHKPKERVNE